MSKGIVGGAEPGVAGIMAGSADSGGVLAGGKEGDTDGRVGSLISIGAKKVGRLSLAGLFQRIDEGAHGAKTLFGVFCQGG